MDSTRFDGVEDVEFVAEVFRETVADGEAIGFECPEGAASGEGGVFQSVAGEELAADGGVSFEALGGELLDDGFAEEPARSRAVEKDEEGEEEEKEDAEDFRPTSFARLGGGLLVWCGGGHECRQGCTGCAKLQA